MLLECYWSEIFHYCLMMAKIHIFSFLAFRYIRGCLQYLFFSRTLSGVKLVSILSYYLVLNLTFFSCYLWRSPFFLLLLKNAYSTTRFLFCNVYSFLRRWAAVHILFFRWRRTTFSDNYCKPTVISVEYAYFC